MWVRSIQMAQKSKCRKVYREISSALCTLAPPVTVPPFTLWIHLDLYACLATQLCRLWDLIDCSLPGSSAHGILQGRILEWVAIPFLRGFSRPRYQAWVSCTAGRFFTVWARRVATNLLLFTKLQPTPPPAPPHAKRQFFFSLLCCDVGKNIHYAFWKGMSNCW